jgi:hypothetical protein
MLQDSRGEGEEDRMQKRKPRINTENADEIREEECD